MINVISDTCINHSLLFAFDLLRYADIEMTENNKEMRC